MKYLAIFLIIISISAQSLNVHSTVVHVQSSKGKHLKSWKAKPVKKLSKCTLSAGENVTAKQLPGKKRCDFKHQQK